MTNVCSDSIIINVKGNRRWKQEVSPVSWHEIYWMSNSKILFRDGSSKLISGFLSLIRMSDFKLLGGLEMRSDLKTNYTQRDTERAGQTEKALYLLNTISAITDRGNNAEVRRKKDGSLTVYEVKKNIVTV